jgi:hypothetical protein
MLVIGTNDTEKLSDFLIEEFDGVIVNLYSALKVAGEDMTVVLITKPGKNAVHLKDIQKMIYIPQTVEQVLTGMLNLHNYDFIEDCRTAPGIIVMRSVGDFAKIISSVRENYDGRTMTLSECLEEGITGQSILCFCEKPLENTIDINDLKQECLLINTNTRELMSKLKNQSLRFLSEGLLDKSWFDIQIRIFDKYGKHKLHYDRLAIILDNFETGIILGESWGRDYPRFLTAVLVYQLRLFTLDNPVNLKKFLMGLEYLDDGTRICGLDLLSNHKKIEWTEVVDKETKGFGRVELALKYRREILNKLNEKDFARIKRYEDEIINTRNL